MATNLALDPGLLDEAQRLGGEPTKKATVTRALEEYIARRRRTGLIELFGTIDWDSDYDHKAERAR